MTAQDFLFRGFSDRDRAERIVDKLHELYIASGPLASADSFSRALAEHLARVPDPDRAVTNLLRFAESTLSASSLFHDLISYPVLMDVLMKMLSSSQYFADILVRDPELFRWITSSDALVKPRSKEFFREEVQRTMRVFQKPEKKLDALRRLYRREILRIGARDILGEADLATVTEELSHLADALVEAACDIARLQLSARFPQQPETPFAVIGLGKLGGRELNYSSDIDIMFVYADEGELTDARGVLRTYHEYFNIFVEKLVQNLSLSTSEGHLYRVDLRLRPEGGAGPLARSLASYLTYYETRGEMWERQMLLKARPVAGNLDFGEGFLAQLEPFIFPRTFFQNPREYIVRIKARIEAAVGGEENVKLRAGGIRDIEFVVQALQLLNGGRNRNIREGNTLRALDRLAEASLINADEHRTLRNAYIFFRTLEHRLQTMFNTQTYELPQAENDRTVLARKVRLSSADELMQVNERHRRAVRTVFENVLNVELNTSSAGIDAVLDGNLDEQSTADVLRRFRFADAAKAAKHLARMVFGSSLTRVRELDSRARETFREVADDLLAEIAATPSPDLTLSNLSLLATAQAFPEQFYVQLKERKFRKLILTICSFSPRCTRGLVKYPLLMERLASDPDALAGVGGDQTSITSDLITFKMQEELRAGIRYVLGLIGFAELTVELSRLADLILRTMLHGQLAELTGRDDRLAVFALGKYGSREMTFDADLDVLFVGNVSGGTEYLERCARELIRRLSELGPEGRLYEVDARLRPEGRSAPLVIEKNAYLSYLVHRASLWERQSLIRLRFVTGDAELGDEVTREVEKFVYESPLPRDWVNQIVEMRKKTETRSRARAADLVDIKLGPGGMADIEFLLQMLQMYAGRRDRSLRRILPVEMIEQLLHDMEGSQHSAFLRDAYGLYRRVETMMRMALDEKGSILPTEDNLDLLARLLGYTTGVELQRHLATTMKEVRGIFLHTAAALQQTVE